MIVANFPGPVTLLKEWNEEVFCIYCVPITKIIMALNLGRFDGDSWPNKYFEDNHDWAQNKGMRGQKKGQWIQPRKAEGSEVTALQKNLRTLGFLPKGAIDGIYGYRTKSAVRLMQEYAKVIEKHPRIKEVDGIAGNDTFSVINEWLKLPGFQASWSGTEEEFHQSLSDLNALKDLFNRSDLPENIQREKRLIEKFANRSSTRSIADSTFKPEDIHLIGIRRNENVIINNRRRNDDIFILLINGMRFVFRGSTNPSPNMGSRRDKAFLIRGQHEYRFGWHKIASLNKEKKEQKVYRAFKPTPSSGPLIVRAVNNLLDEKSFETARPNRDINIHWSGSGTSNWSAGCQVIAGMKYVDFRNKLVDCSGRAAAGYSDLSGRKTKAAYNVMIDLMTVHADKPTTKNGSTILYTLLYEDDVRHVGSGKSINFNELVKVLE